MRGVVLLALSGALAYAAEFAPVRLTKTASGFDLPVQLTHAADGTGRVYVVEQKGIIRLLRNGAPVERPLLDIHERVSCCGERGLLSVAFPPEFARRRHFRHELLLQVALLNTLPAGTSVPETERINLPEE